jgi:anaerobic selenocysteine-containing dehydrogenase
MVHASRGRLPPASPRLRSEPAIVAAMAQATLPASRIPWLQLVEDYDLIRDRIAAVLPDFEDYNTRIRKPGGFRLPLPPTQRIWKTASGKAEFLLRKAEPVGVSQSALRLTTIRSHDQYNTTIYGFDDRYRGVFGRRDVLFMNEHDLALCGIGHGDRVDVETAMGGPRTLYLRGFTAIAHDIARGSVAAYYPEANVLVPLEYHDAASGTPSYKSIPVIIRAAAAVTAQTGSTQT